MYRIVYIFQGLRDCCSNFLNARKQFAAADVTHGPGSKSRFRAAFAQQTAHLCFPAAPELEQVMRRAHQQPFVLSSYVRVREFCKTTPGSYNSLLRPSSFSPFTATAKRPLSRLTRLAAGVQQNELQRGSLKFARERGALGTRSIEYLEKCNKKKSFLHLARDVKSAYF